VAQFIRVGQYIINPDNIAYIEETGDSATSGGILVHLTGSEKAPIHISAHYSAGFLNMLNITTIHADPTRKVNTELDEQLRAIRDKLADSNRPLQ
jgi:hypothetical protein